MYIHRPEGIKRMESLIIVYDIYMWHDSTDVMGIISGVLAEMPSRQRNHLKDAGYYYALVGWLQ